MSKVMIGIVQFGERKSDPRCESSVGELIVNSTIPVEVVFGTEFTPELKPIENIALNRQHLAEKAINLGFNYLLFLDDDLIVQPETLQLLYEGLEADSRAAICAGVYAARGGMVFGGIVPHPQRWIGKGVVVKYPIPLVFQELNGIGPYFEFPTGQIFPCKGIATGCMLIRTKIFEQLAKPWFHSSGQIGEDTEDIYFCRKVLEAGFSILAHGGVLPDHIGRDGSAYTLRPAQVKS